MDPSKSNQAGNAPRASLRMTARHLSVFICLSACFQIPALASDTPIGKDWQIAGGVLAHDRGPLSDAHENGVDINLEIQFSPLDFPGTPRSHLGFTLNFTGDTSVAYAGLVFRFKETPHWFLDGFIDGVTHNGPLHKDPIRCQQFSDCGYGTRFMPRFGLETGYKLKPDTSLALLVDHMSHKWVIEGENEGLDHIGLRYIKAF